MKAIRVHSHGGPGVLSFEDVPEPTPGPGQALLAVEAVGLNFIEVYFREGLYRPASLPYTPGTECAGTVVALGDGVTEVAVGDRVATVNAVGAYAEKAVAPSARLVRLPDGVSTTQGAAALLQGMTAHYLAFGTHRLSPADTCLVHAAAGGVGLLLCQLARNAGARVIGTVSTEEKAVLAREAGAHEVIVTKTSDFAAEVKRLTGGSGVTVVYDSVGKDTFERGLDVLARRGLMVLFGQSSGPVGPIDPQILNQKGSLFLTRPTLVHYTATREELLERAAAVLSGIAEGRLTLRVDREVPLAEAAEAHRALEARETMGKVLLRVSS